MRGSDRSDWAVLPRPAKPRATTTGTVLFTGVNRNVGCSGAAAGHSLTPTIGFWLCGRLACAEHVLHLFESMQQSDSWPRQAIEQVRAWTRGETCWVGVRV